MVQMHNCLYIDGLDEHLKHPYQQLWIQRPITEDKLGDYDLMAVLR